MGGSGGTFRSGKSPAEIAGKLREQTEASAAEFETTLAKEFNKLLARFNTRDSVFVQERLGEIKDALESELETSFDTFFGGSVAKHTFVDGISDVDSLLVLLGSLSKKRPSDVLQKLEKALSLNVEDVQVTSGRVAITVTYPDGTEIQLVPTVREEESLKVPAWESNRWSTIDPKQFTDALTKRNQQCNSKLIPVLKLAKAVNSTLPESMQLSGYHIESLGVAAFRGYAGEKTTVRMLPYFFRKASELVLKPMVDGTGQSVHVDQHLGAAGSEARIVLSHTLARIHQRMLNASAAHSTDRWRDLLGE